MSVAFNIPNTLTWFRIACIPLVVLVYYLPYPWAQPAAAWIFGAAAITDGLDGYLARKLNQMSKFGAFLDPVADKVTVAVALLLVTHTDERIIVLLVSAIIIGREITISALREWMAGIGERGKVAVIDVAKYKTLAQMFGVAPSCSTVKVTLCLGYPSTNRPVAAGDCRRTHVVVDVRLSERSLAAIHGRRIGWLTGLARRIQYAVLSMRRD